jgi:hypothetical protein
LIRSEQSLKLLIISVLQSISRPRHWPSFGRLAFTIGADRASGWIRYASHIHDLSKIVRLMMPRFAPGRPSRCVVRRAAFDGQTAKDSDPCGGVNSFGRILRRLFVECPSRAG